MKATINFLNWYKDCCSKDMSRYRTVQYSFKKANVYYSIFFDKDCVLYPINGTQELIGGKKEFCENYIKENINTKFFAFSIKNDQQSVYYIKNDTITIL